MDLGAYQNIDSLGSILKDNGIVISRLRGLRLMSKEEKVSDEELNEEIKAAQVTYAYAVLIKDFNYKTRPAFIYDDECNVVDIDLNKVHGKTKKDIRFEWKKIEKAYKVVYDIYNSYVGKNVLYVHARQGGGNRRFYPIDTKHPMYLADIDDPFDDTYCDIYYDLDKAKEAK